MSESEFDRVADAELHYLERALGELDPDEAEADLSSGVLTLTLADGGKIIVNSHRAAGQIWMAAFRTAWHFSPSEEAGLMRWRTAKDELRSTLARLLTEKLGKNISV
jgi:CyaY protein